MSSTPASAILAALIPVTPTDATLPMATTDGAVVDTAFSRLFEAEATAANTVQNSLAALPNEDAQSTSESATEALMFAQLVLTQRPMEMPETLPDIDLNETGELVEHTDVSGTELADTEIEAQETTSAPTPKTTTTVSESISTAKTAAQPIEIPLAPTTEKTEAPQSEITETTQPIRQAKSEKHVAETVVADAIPSEDSTITTTIRSTEKTVAVPEEKSAKTSEKRSVSTSNEPIENKSIKVPAKDSNTEVPPQVAQEIPTEIPAEIHRVLQEMKSADHAFVVPHAAQENTEVSAAEDTDERVPEVNLEAKDLAAFPHLQAIAHLNAAIHAQPTVAPQQNATPAEDTLDESERPLEAITSNEKKSEGKHAYEKPLATASAPAMSDNAEACEVLADAAADEAPQNAADDTEAFSLPALPTAQNSETVEESIRIVSDRGTTPSKTQAADTQIIHTMAPKKNSEKQSVASVVQPSLSTNDSAEIEPQATQKISTFSTISPELNQLPLDEKNVEALPTKTLESQPANLLIKESAAAVAGTRQSSLEGFSYGARRDEISASAAPVPFFDGGRPETIATQNPTSSTESALPPRAEKLFRETLASIPNPFRVTTFEIKPEGFGTLRVKISSRGEGENAVWKVQIQTSDPAARSLLSEHMNELRERMPAAENVKVELAAQATSEPRNESNRQEQGSNRERNEGRAQREESQRQSDKQKRGGNFLEWLAERE